MSKSIFILFFFTAKFCFGQNDTIRMVKHEVTYDFKVLNDGFKEANKNFNWDSKTTVTYEEFRGDKPYRVNRFIMDSINGIEFHFISDFKENDSINDVELNFSSYSIKSPSQFEILNSKVKLGMELSDIYNIYSGDQIFILDDKTMVILNKYLIQMSNSKVVKITVFKKWM